MNAFTLANCVLAAALAFAGPASLAQTDLAQAPVPFLLTSPVKPNIFFILDDSGSMQWSGLGDEVYNYRYENTIGYRSSLCNKLYYNPQVSYPVPVDASGQPYPQQSFNAARYDGFQPGSIAVDLSTSFMAWRSSASSPSVPQSGAGVTYTQDCLSCNDATAVLKNRPEPAYYFVYKGDKADHLGDGSADDDCKLASDDGRSWSKVLVGAGSGPGGSDETQNFANWFSYHRTRMLTMKTAIGRAFSQLDGNFRVGFSVISDGSADGSGTGFLNIADFSGEQRRKFYEKLYAVVPVASTPLRAALSKAGRLFAGKLLSGGDDPVRYSCQQNISILSTDGYWNTGAERGSFGPKRIDGQTDVGSPDSDLRRPMYDGIREARPQRMATITLLPGGPNTLETTEIGNIHIDGLAVMRRGEYVRHNSGNLTADAALLARYVADSVTLRGYRAIAEENVVTIIAPAAAGDTVSAPVIFDMKGQLVASVTSFEAKLGNARSRNTLADVAAYYFETDLRTPALGNCGTQKVCENNLRAAPRGVTHQHMVTHTIGFGVNGTLRYREDYDTAAGGDFARIVAGEIDWPDLIYAPGPERVDDLWHAAVNGGGRYFSARNPESLARALSAMMATIRAAAGAAAASASSSQEPIEGDNLLFSSRYRSMYWDGDLEARRIQLGDGSLSASAEWSAASQLQQRIDVAADRRTIYLPSSASADGLKPFLWSKLDAGERALFSGLCSREPPRRLSQCAQLSELQQAQAGDENLVNYLRGQFRLEDRQDNPLRLFRRRDFVLGAPVNAQPLYVGSPAFRYADDNYGEFRDSVAAGRSPTVYLAANDGMLHAFDAATGDERWAFVPAGVLPELWRSADISFGNGFRYLLDGTPVAGDICPSAPTTSCTASDWRTILVGGLGAAGREYYALDITNPAQPKYLWRLSVDSEPDLGFSLGKPVITKRRDGRWVVVIASGYNNVNPGSGRGLLFVLDAATGAVLQRIDTGVGSAAAPAGLAQLNVWIDSTLDNTAARLFGGDLLGNLWRFDINEAGPVPALVARFVREGKIQPITTRPELSQVRIGNRAIAIVTVGTGSYLGVTDARDKSVQSIYTLRDDPKAGDPADVRSDATMVKQRLIAGDGTRTISAEPVDWLANRGWYVDLDAEPGSGERVNLDPVQQLGVLRVFGNIPGDQVCRPAAGSWAYAFRYLNGNPLASESRASVGLRTGTDSLLVGARQVRIGSRLVDILTDSAGTLKAVAQPTDGGKAPSVRRMAWRELDQQ